MSDDTSHLAERLAANQQTLLSEGYAVIDDALPARTASMLIAEMRTLHKAGGLRQHRFAVRGSNGQAVLYTKPRIFEAEIEDEAVKQLAPQFRAHLTELSQGLQATASGAFPALSLSTGTSAVSIKLQANEGGSFPYHYDNAGPPSKRRLTALFYLNPGWQESHGGELVLLPWLRSPISVPPLHNRLVLFLSDAVLHAVRPKRGGEPRFCFTFWLDGTSTNAPSDLRLDSRTPCEELHLHPAQRLLSRATYAEEYAASIRDCFVETPDQMRAMLSSHDAMIASAMASAAFASLVGKARQKKDEINELARQASEREARRKADGASAEAMRDARQVARMSPLASDSISVKHDIEVSVRALAPDRVASSVRVRVAASSNACNPPTCN